MMARTRLKQYEQDHGDCRISVADQKKMWKIVSHQGRGPEERNRLHLCSGCSRFDRTVSMAGERKYGYIDRPQYVRTGGIEGCLLAMLNLRYIRHHESPIVFNATKVTVLL
jgi:hypothetical protein